MSLIQDASTCIELQGCSRSIACISDLGVPIGRSDSHPRLGR